MWYVLSRACVTVVVFNGIVSFHRFVYTYSSWVEVLF